jgi:hypothetical protein
MPKSIWALIQATVGILLCRVEEQRVTGLMFEGRSHITLRRYRSPGRLRFDT